MNHLASIAAPQVEPADDVETSFRVCDFRLGDRAYRLIGDFGDPGRLSVRAISVEIASANRGVPLCASQDELDSVYAELNDDSMGDNSWDLPDRRRCDVTPPTALEVALSETVGPSP